MATVADLFRPGRSGIRTGEPIGRASSMFTNFRAPIDVNFTTPDLQSIALNTERSKAARDLLTAARIEQANRDLALLRHASASPTTAANLFSAPTNPQDAAVQKLVLNDMNARERGVALIPNWQQMQAYEKGILSNRNLQENIEDSQFGRQLREHQFQQQQQKNLFDILNQQQLREQARQNAAAQERYRQAQISNAEKNRQQRDKQFGMTQAQRDFANMLAIERMLQDKADEEARQQRGTYHDAATAAEKGALPLPDVSRLFGDVLSPEAQALVEGYARQSGKAQAGFNDYIRAQAEDANRRLQEQVTADAPSWYQFWKDNPNPDTYAQAIQSQLDKNRDVRGRLMYDAANDRFVPVGLDDPSSSGMDDEPLNDELNFGAAPLFNQAPPRATVPAPRSEMRAPFTEGQTIRNRRTGQLFRVQGGQLVPIR